MKLKDYTDTHTQIALAKSIGAAPSFVNQWVNGDRPIPAPYCVSIERTTGGQVTRQELRPDDFWLIWPDLQAPADIAQAATN
jgi:DNA-binding transcriptional regulator YdaS (Cro superfamily)